MHRNDITEEEAKQILELYQYNNYQKVAHIIHRGKNVIKRFLIENKVFRTFEEEQARASAARKQTCIQKYGCENPAQSKIVQEKRKQTCLEKYGVEYGFQYEEIKEKIKYSTLEHYGVKNISQSKEIKQKKENTRLSNLSEEAIARIKFNKLTIYEKYGVDSGMDKDEFYKWRRKQTIKQKYGVDYNWQIPAVKEKIRTTCLQKYGKLNFGHKRLYKFNNEHFDSFPELCFYMYYIQNNIEIKHEPVSLRYIFEDKAHFYTPDFMINEILYELKGNHLVDDSGNWVCPFDRSLDKLVQAKQQCAIKNKVKILYTEDYQKYIDWFYKNGYKREDFIV